MKFSVIVPTCDRPALLRACLERLAPGRQTLPSDAYEVIVTDDGVRPVEQVIESAFPWARWTRGPRRGPAANRNHGASFARGEWLVFTDDDCLPEAGWLDAFATAIATDAVVAAWEGRTYCAEREWGPLRFAPVNERGGLLWSCNLALARGAFTRLGGFDATFPHAHLEDVDLRWRIKRAGLAHRFCPAAAIEHPSRPVGPVLAQVRAHASYFHLARRHGVSLAATGLSPHALARWRWQLWRSRRTAAEGARFAVRTIVEVCALAPLLAWWWLRGRHRP